MKVELRTTYGITWYKMGSLYWLCMVGGYRVYVGLKGRRIHCGPFVMLTEDGYLHIADGYVWDGPSGIAIPTDNFMRGSLIHDALYQMLREGVLLGVWEGWGHERLRKLADRWLRRHCTEDGMTEVRAWWVYHGVQLGGKSSAALGSTWRGDSKLARLRGLQRKS